MMFGEVSQMAVDLIRIVTQSSVKGRSMDVIEEIDNDWRIWRA
jgi:hypothetical protein